MCVDHFHIVSPFLSHPCTPSTLSKEAFVYFVCPTEIPQPPGPFAWKYYHTVSMWSNNHYELFARQLIHSYDLVNSAFKISLSHNVFSHKLGGGVKNTFRNTGKYLWYSRQFEQKFVQNLRNRLPQTKDWHMVYSLRVTTSSMRWFEATRPLEFYIFWRFLSKFPRRCKSAWVWSWLYCVHVRRRVRGFYTPNSPIQKENKNVHESNEHLQRALKSKIRIGKKTKRTRRIQNEGGFIRKQI